MTYLVNALGYLHFNVTDLAASVKDATEVLGLHVTERKDRLVLLSSNGRRAELILEQSAENSTRCIGLEAMCSGAVREVTRRVKESNCQILRETPSFPFIKEAVTFMIPDGHILEVHTPIPDSIYSRRQSDRGVSPTRIDHVNVTSSTPVETRCLLSEILGLRLSERLADDSLAWMRGGNRQHHIFGIVRGPAGLHHYAWEVPEFIDFMRLGDVLDRKGRQLLWGPGRHRPGDNIYSYYLDVAGAMVECSQGMAYIADDETFEPNVIRDLERPENVRSMNCWGTPAPQEWLQYHSPLGSLSSFVDSNSKGKLPSPIRASTTAGGDGGHMIRELESSENGE
jgi:catechol 2,3-dioxygenase